MNKKFSSLLADFESYIKQTFAALPKSALTEAMEYSVLNGGKRIRPLLLFATLQGYGKDPKLGFPAAAAIEMVHSYSLVHDDLPSMDNDDLRRGKPSCHKAFGEDMAILAGDALQPFAFEVLAQSAVEPSVLVKMVKLLAHKAGAAGMVYGQVLDLEGEKHPLSLEQLTTMEALKTGCLLQLPFEMAALIAGREDHLFAWDAIGRMLGLEFQIQDDILDVTSSLEKLGKINSDQRNHKSTFVSVAGLKEAKEAVLEYDASIRQEMKVLGLEQQALIDMMDLLLEREH